MTVGSFCDINNYFAGGETNEKFSIMEFNAKQIIKRRVALGMSRKTLADVAGMPYNTVWRIETGQREPLASTLVALAKALRLKSVNYFFQKSALGAVD